ncbi:uncharacterized protein LOC131038838 isoform X2 [Cryptomeria japonica]|uniref:uncharacterized protein LOC131038838 isoform X2 n=1 Tax=Cryptomeria japonica TaxID=3369 RepID=UPI0025AD24BD|nr:uncharacterized protein LOC131038838 isoform X2 [Cryptomeria japonica]
MRTQMELILSTSLAAKNSTGLCLVQSGKCKTGKWTSRRKVSTVKASIVNDIVSAAAADPAVSSDFPWETTVGALGVAPFVIAGIEFRKRIVAQKKCDVCKGSGLVKREKYYFRCYGCGGFLPWQSWKRFFSG